MDMSLGEIDVCDGSDHSFILKWKISPTSENDAWKILKEVEQELQKHNLTTKFLCISNISNTSLEACLKIAQLNPQEETSEPPDMNSFNADDSLHDISDYDAQDMISKMAMHCLKKVHHRYEVAGETNFNNATLKRKV